MSPCLSRGSVVITKSSTPDLYVTMMTALFVAPQVSAKQSFVAAMQEKDEAHNRKVGVYLESVCSSRKDAGTAALLTGFCDESMSDCMPQHCAWWTLTPVGCDPTGVGGGGASFEGAVAESGRDRGASGTGGQGGGNGSVLILITLLFCYRWSVLKKTILVPLLPLLLLLIIITAPPHSSSPCPPARQVPDSQKGASTSLANKGLVQKLEDLELTFNRAKVEWGRERRQLMSSHAQEIQELNILHREQVTT
jgi:hypothetical protein